MHIAIRHVAGIEHADIRVDKGICLVSGRNFAGKSTILKMAAAALCGVAIPTSALKKKDAKAMVRRGAKNGFVRVTDEDGIVDISYPACDVTTEGRAPHASTLAVGRADLTTMNEQDRARALADLLKTEPSQEELRIALEDGGGVADDMLDKVTATAWVLVETHGWDGAAKMAQENGAKLKGRWEQVTGENYGVDKARDWRPAALRLGTSRPDLETAVAEAAATLNGLVGATAVSAADREQMEALSATLAERQATAETAEKAQYDAAHAFEIVRKARDALPGTMTGGNTVCPCCDKPLFVKPNHGGGGGFRIEKAEPVSTADLQKRRDAFAAAEGELQRLTAVHATANRAHISAQAALKMAEDSKARLAKLGTAPDNGAAVVAQARADVAATEAALKAIDDKTQADDINASIGRTLAVVDALRADGVRKAKLIKTLDGFNETLRAHTDVAGWKAITITPDLEIEYAATPLFLCSESEAWRCRAALRLAVAKLQGSPIVILDGADVLDNPGRQGLFKMLMKAGVPALVAMTIDGPPGSQADPKSLVPDLAKHGIGASWWINAGVAEAIGETKAEAA